MFSLQISFILCNLLLLNSYLTCFCSFLYTSLIYPVLIPILGLWGWLYRLLCINCTVSLMVPFSLEFCDVLNLLFLGRRNYLKYGLQLRSLNLFALPDTQELPNRECSYRLEGAVISVHTPWGLADVYEFEGSGDLFHFTQHQPVGKVPCCPLLCSGPTSLQLRGASSPWSPEFQGTLEQKPTCAVYLTGFLFSQLLEFFRCLTFMSTQWYI